MLSACGSQSGSTDDCRAAILFWKWAWPFARTRGRLGAHSDSEHQILASVNTLKPQIWSFAVFGRVVKPEPPRVEQRQCGNGRDGLRHRRIPGRSPREPRLIPSSGLISYNYRGMCARSGGAVIMGAGRGTIAEMPGARSCR